MSETPLDLDALEHLYRTTNLIESSDVFALIAEVRRLRAEREVLVDQGFWAGVESVAEQANAALRERDRLRDALDRARALPTPEPDPLTVPCGCPGRVVVGTFCPYCGHAHKTPNCGARVLDASPVSALDEELSRRYLTDAEFHALAYALAAIRGNRPPTDDDVRLAGQFAAAGATVAASPVETTTPEPDPLTVDCPYCKSTAGNWCVSGMGMDREAHPERVAASRPEGEAGKP